MFVLSIFGIIYYCSRYLLYYFHKNFAHLHYVGLAAVNTEKKRIGLVKYKLGKGKEIVMSPTWVYRSLSIMSTNKLSKLF